jgi:uncharacterized membrane protein YgcG
MRFFAAILLSLLWLSPAMAEEVIRNFNSDVTVNVDGVLDVTETITLRAEGAEIKRGFLRDFPTTYTDRNGVRVRVGLDVLGVTRDGRDEPYATESMSNGVRIRIGAANVFLQRGEHTYVITYRTTRQVGFFADFDELNWNVTGNGWTFPIESASARVVLPAGASVGRPSAYTGAQGEKGSAAEVTLAQGNRFEAATTQRLEPREGFTIAVAWQKGIVASPTEAAKQRDWVLDNLGYFVLALTAVLVPLYYAWAWWRVGRDPLKGTIVPLFAPPASMGPSGVRYVYKAGYDDKAFAAGLVGLAVKGRMKIFNEDDAYRIRKQDGDRSALTRSEAALVEATPSGTLELEQSNHAAVIGMRSALQAALDDEYDGVMYLKNLKWFVLGFALTAVGLLLAAFLMPSEGRDVLLFAGLFTSVWWGVILAVGVSAVRGAFGGSGLFSKIRSLMSLIFLVPFVGAGFAVPAFVWASGGPPAAMKWFILAAVGLALCNLVFYWLLKAPTPRGRAVLDQIEGFRMYMTTAEEERLKVLHPPEKTPQLFERYLPYAMALDCENQWNDKFASVLAAAATAGATAGAIGGWYAGPGGFGSRDFGSSLGNSLSSSISSSGVAPGSVSGSGGGGFSGGGGGGGGGSGW